MKKYLAFDIDGTIYDAGNIVVEAFELGVQNYVDSSKNKELHIPKHREIVKLLGLTMENIFVSLYPELSVAERLLLMRFCTDSFVFLIREKKGEIFDGVIDIIFNLKEDGYCLVPASNGKREYVNAILETYGLIEKFESIMYFPEETHEDGTFLADKNAVVHGYMKNMDSADKIIMIGDRFTDREAAENNNIPFIGCAFGHAGMEEISDCKWVVHSFNEIPSVIEKILE